MNNLLRVGIIYVSFIGIPIEQYHRYRSIDITFMPRMLKKKSDENKQKLRNLNLTKLNFYGA